jgi:structure-specific recognition protein 1
MRCASIAHGRHKGSLTLTDTRAEWRNAANELKQTIDFASVKKAIWLLGKQVSLKLLDGEKVVKFGGFQDSQRDEVANVLKAANADIAFTTQEVNVRGGTWVSLQSGDGECVFSSNDNTYLFDFSLDDVAQVNQNDKNKDIGVVFSRDDSMGQNDQMLSEIKFYIENEDLRKDWAEKVKGKVSDGPSAGAALLKYNEIPFTTPRARQDLLFFNKYCKLKGRSADYTIKYTDISRLLMLKRNDNVSVSYIIGLDVPLRMGATNLTWLVMKFDEEDNRAPIENTLDESQETALEMKNATGEWKDLYAQFAQVFKTLAEKNTMIATSSFKTALGTAGMYCTYKTNPGALYCMKKALCFIDKPVIFLPFEQIVYCEFGSGAGYSRGPTKNFNLLVAASQGQKFTFETMDKKEYNGLVDFLQKAGVKLKNLEKSKPAEEDLLPDEDSEDDEEYEEGESEDESSAEEEESEEEERPKKKRKKSK